MLAFISEKLEARRRAFTAIAVCGMLVAATLAITASRSFGSGDTNPATFDPTLTFETSTTRATAHPDARITIDNSGNTANIRSVRMELPDGFWGSLGAVTSKCVSFVAGSGATGSDSCTSAHKIGKVKSTATIDQSDATITGDVFLVDSASSADAAGVGIRVRAKVGGVDLGYVRVLGRAQLRGNAQGMNTIVENIPASITDTNGRTVSFHLDRMTVDLTSDLNGPNAPLLTNPSACGAKTVNAVANTNPTLGVGDYTIPAVTYTVTGCDTVKFSPTTFAFTPSGNASGSNIGFTNQIDIPVDSASIKSLVVTMPAGLGANFPSFGASSDQCPSGSAPTSSSIFDPTSCPSRVSLPGQPHLGPARIGTVTIESPLMPDPVTGYVYLINKSPLPWLGIDVNPSIPGNPAGVTIRLLGTTDTPQRDSTCSPGDDGYCQSNIVARFQNLPDAPVSSIDLDMNRGPRLKADESASLVGEILNIAAAGECQPADEVTAQFTTHSNSGPTPSRAGRVSTFSATGCDLDPVNITSGPVGLTTADATPTFDISAGSFYCAVNVFSVANPGASCSTNFTSATLSNGFVHRFYVGTADNYNGGSNTTRAFAVENNPAPDTTAPTTTINTGPSGDTSDATPSFTFSGTDNVTAPGSLAFQCSVDDGAFLPCTSGFTTESFFASDTNHTFRVRAQDAAGNVDLTPDSKTFKIVIPFAPAMTVLSTTNVARAHPDLDITIDNLSHEDVKDVTVSLPDGFFGGLQGVAEICAVAAADAGSCPAGSKVGTVETEGIVDESVIRINGEVFLTEARQTGDAAGLSIKVPAVIQDIDMGNIIVSARASVRGEAKGMDTMVVQVPNSIDPAVSGNTYDSETFFDLRKMVMKIRTNPGAAQPFLTNPSSCDTGNFVAIFKGYNGTDGTSTVPYPIAGCEALAFAPALAATIELPGGGPPNASDFQNIDLSATLNAQPGEAGIKAANILMPKPLTMDVTKLPPLCEKVQYDLDACPSTTIIGSAVATTPLLLPGETISGPVYLLRGDNTVMPRLYVRLSGRITVRFIGKTSFDKQSQTQLRTEFSDLPDAPLSTFTMNVTNLLSTMKKPCELGDKYGYSMTGTLTGHNNKTATVDSPFVFDCAGIALKSSFKKGKRPKLDIAFQTKGSQPKLKSVKVQLPKYLTLNKRTIKRKLSLKADGKRLKSKCFRVVNASTLFVNLCGKRAARIELKFRPGSLIANKKLRKGRVKLTFKDVAGKTTRQSYNLFSKAFASDFKLP